MGHGLDSAVLDVLSKPADEIGPADIDALVVSALSEGDQVEFKRGLSTAKRKRDPWEDGKEPGDKAKAEILEEVTAFANAYGGVLLLGIDESSTTPAVASAIVPIPRCADLAERFKHVFRDCVEPQLSSLEVFAVPTNGEAGVVLFRVGRSHDAPHRVTKTLACPIRRADRCERMTMREIQDMTLSVSRGLSRLEHRLSERSTRFTREFECLSSPDHAFGCRFTAVPRNDDVEFDSVIRNHTLTDTFNMPWRRILMNGRPLPHVDCGPGTWRTMLRGARSDVRLLELEQNKEGQLVPRTFDWNFYHEIHCDGLVEFGGVHVPMWSHQSFPPGWLFVMFGNLLLWATNIRSLSHSVGMDFILEVELYMPSRQPLPLDQYGDQHWRAENTNQQFPHYIMGRDSNLNEILSAFHRDAFHLVGQDANSELTIAT